MKNKFIKMICFLLPAVFSLAFISSAVSAEELETEPYYFYSGNYRNNILLRNIEAISVNPSETAHDMQGVTLLTQGEAFGYPEGVVSFSEKASFSFDVNVPKAGGYTLTVDYFIPEEYFFNLVLAVSVNGEYQFYESRSLDMPVRWKDVSQQYKTDEFGNDMFPKPERIYEWEQRALNSTQYLLKVPFAFYFEEGVNTVTIENNEVQFLLGNVTLNGKESVISAEAYKAQNDGKSFADEIIVIEGQHYSAKSQSYITAEKSSDHNAMPYEPPYNKINALAEASWADAGNFVEYEFTAKEDAMYYICFKYMAEDMKNKPNYKNIYIDGVPLFDEMLNYKIDFTPKYINEIIHVDGENVPVYLTKGSHTLRLESTADMFYDSYENLVGIINEINDLAIEIKYITGNKTDKNREWEIENYIPDIEESLIRMSDMLETEYDRLMRMCGSNTVGEISNLKVASGTLVDFSRDLDSLVNNMDRFSQGSSSVTEYISVLLPTLLYQNMKIEKIYVTGDLSKIERPNAGFITSLAQGTRKFLLSFTNQQDQGGTHSNDKLNIWVGKSMMHIELMREKFAVFTNETGIEVNISSMPDEQRLLLAVSAGTAPDLVIGASNYRPFDFALRGAIQDLRGFPDFADILGDFNSEMYVPFIINDSCYALPETIDFMLMYYRKDILDRLGLSVPKTWDDVILMLPELSRFGMSFNTPIANAGGTKHFGTTVPFIQQFNGKIYSEDGTRVELGDPNTVAAFKLMTDLYTRYSMPESIPSFYNSFRRGVTPIGMATLQTYYLIRFGAPELSGQWGMAPSVGVDDGTGNILNYQASVANCSMIMKGTGRADDAWTALKWWMDENTQLEYANDLQLRFGSTYIYNTANLKAFAKMKTIPEDTKAIMLEQLASTKEIPRNPAYFQVERSLSNAWNQVVFQGASPRTALDNAIITCNREITKKLKEFGYMDDKGNLLKAFEMGSGEKVESWKAGAQ